MAKAAVLLEIAILFGGGLAIKRANGASWEELFVGGTLDKLALANVLLLAILLSAVDLGAGGWAAAFGALIALGYLLAAAGGLGMALADVENAYFGAGTYPTGPAQSSENQAR